MRKVVWGGAAFAVLLCTSACSTPAGETTAGTAAGPAAAAAKAAPSPAVLERGATLYKANCASCHGESGKGDGPAAAVMKPPPTDHTNATYMATLSDEDLAKVIQMGGAMRGKPLMPSNPQLRGDDLDALVAFTRGLSAQGN